MKYRKNGCMRGTTKVETMKMCNKSVLPKFLYMYILKYTLIDICISKCSFLKFSENYAKMRNQFPGKVSDVYVTRSLTSVKEAISSRVTTTYF